MSARSERRLHTAAYAVCLVMGILIVGTFAPPLLLALFAVPSLLRRRRARFVPNQPLPVALQETQRWSTGRW